MVILTIICTFKTILGKMSRVEMFKYYFRYDVGGTWHYYYVDTSGVVQNTTTKTPLQFAPKGWQNKSLKWERGFVYHGIFQSFTIPLEFVKDGATILRYLYVNYGTEGECQFYIEKHGNTIANPFYDVYYYGDIDFSRYNDKKDFVNCEVMEGGFMAKLKAKENTDMEIEVADSGDRVWVNMDGLEMAAVFSFTGMEQPVDNLPPTFVASARENFPTLLYFQTEGYANGDHNPKGNDFIANFQQMKSLNYGGADVISVGIADNWVIRNVGSTLSYDYRIKGSISIDHINSVASTRQMSVFVYACSPTAVTPTKITIATGGTIPALGTLSEVIEFDQTITLAPTEAIWLFFRHSGLAGQVSYHMDTCNMTATVLNKVPQSYIPARRTFDVFNEMVGDISPTTMAVSSLLQTTHATKVITCGDALRGLLKSVLKTNISQFYKAMDCMFNTSMKYTKSTDRVYIVPKAEAFIEATQILDLGEISNLVNYPLTAEMFAKLKIGYPKVQIDDVNGKDEFNIEHIYQSPLVRVTNEKDLTSEYHASMYEIETARANLTGKTLADKDSDNSVYWLDIEATPAGVIPAGLPGAGEDYYNLQRSGYTITQGLVSPSTAFNLYLSPKLRVRAHGNYINSVLHPQFDLSADLTFRTASKTPDDQITLEWDISGSPVLEQHTEELTDLDPAIFYPIVFEFDSLIPQNILAVLDGGPYGKVRFEYNGLEFFGFLLAMQDEPATKPKQSYKLLCSTSTDLNNLIV